MTDRRRNFLVLLFVAGLLILSGLVIATQPTVLGLDLKGGVSLVYQAKPTKQSLVTGEAVDRTIDIMRKRVDTLGVAEPEIQRTGTDQIDVSLPNVTNADQAAAQVGKTAQLYFYDWETNVLGPNCKAQPTDAAVTGGSSAGSGAGAVSQYDAVARAAKCPATNSGKETTTGQYYLVNDKTKKVLAGPQETKADLEAEVTANKITQNADSSVVHVNQGAIVVQAEGKNTDKYYVMRDAPALGGTDITNPKQSLDSGAGGNGQPTVTFDFTDKGQAVWQQITRQIAQRGQDSFFGGDARSSFQHFAIVLDGKLISAPYIDFQQNPDGIDATNGSQISGGFTIATAQELANLLKTGALPIKLDLISASSVSASLGKQALNQGAIAGLIGLALVSLFLLVVYRVLGLIAIGALGVYAVFLFALVKLIPVTLTLPGIAGLILTIGVAADANIVIFERVKEEVRLGRAIPVAISQGYRKGLTAIIDANVVTFMVAFILFMLATAGVKGFAFTLGVGTIVSFLTAVLLTQAVLGTLARSRTVSSPAMLGTHSKRQRFRWDYMGSAKWFFSLSGVILLVGALAVGTNGLNLGIDFTSGTRIVAELPASATEQGVRDAVVPVAGNAKVQRVSGADFKGGQAFQVSVDTVAPGERAKLEKALNAKFGQGTYSFETIGPTFGKTVADSAIIAIIASLIVISSYIALRFEWRYAVPVLVALMHDLLITAGVYALLGLEVTTSTVAALLTILGYSLYDTIIVFDRVRENVPRMPRATFSQILNRSMSEVLMRSLATSFCTLLPIISLLILGGPTLQDFAVALTVGVISGTYSSIFIATPVLMHWKEGESVWRSRRARVAEANGGVVPAYATAAGGAATEVEPEQPKQPRGRLTSPDDPERSVSGAEFDAMVRDLHGDQAPTATEQPERPETVTEPAPAPEPGAQQTEPPPLASSGADALPEDLVLKDDPSPAKSPRRKRNRKHGRR